MPKTLGPTSDALYRIKRGLSGYVSYLAACEMNVAFSEYVLYEPTLRILTALRLSVECEVPCVGLPRTGKGGDYKRLDFVAKGDGVHFALEMKWTRSKAGPQVAKDIQKLQNFRQTNADALGLLCIFGRKSNLGCSSLMKRAELHERGEAVIAEFGITKYGCRIFEVVDGQQGGADE